MSLCIEYTRNSTIGLRKVLTKSESYTSKSWGIKYLILEPNAKLW